MIEDFGLWYFPHGYSFVFNVSNPFKKKTLVYSGRQPQNESMKAEGHVHNHQTVVT